MKRTGELPYDDRAYTDLVSSVRLFADAEIERLAADLEYNEGYSARDAEIAAMKWSCFGNEWRPPR